MAKEALAASPSAKERLDDACGVTDWTLHDLRRTMATRMADLGVQPHVIEAILNHVTATRRAWRVSITVRPTPRKSALLSICGAPTSRGCLRGPEARTSRR